jgi:capsular polysaccharide export protein
MIGVLSNGIAAIPHLESMLGESWERVSWWRGSRRPLDKIVGWGARGPARRARAWAALRGLPYVALEDGFLRSVGLGHQDPPLSIVTDDLGVYFDSRSPSRLEELIKAAKSPAQWLRADRLALAWRQARVSKYNHAREDATPGFDSDEPLVLVIDQTRDDPSIEGGLAGARDFARMLESALDEQTRGRIVLKAHPDVVAGRKRGHFERITPGQLSRLTVLHADAHPASLIERAACVYVVSSQIGFEGLLWDRPVRTFGLPFYAGWGLTRDEMPRPRRRHAVKLQDLVHAGLVEYMHCVDPETGAPCGVETLIAHLSLQRSMRMRFPAQLHAVNFSRWKEPIVRSFFAGSEVHFVRHAKLAPADATFVTWGAPLSAEMSGRRVIRTEDGFLRSAGLGADLTRPLSWTCDGAGIHYDPTRPSDLELLLSSTTFDAALLRRAALLRGQIVDNRVTKYNVDAPPAGTSGEWQRPDRARLIMVAGQVEDDASLRYGPVHMRTNIELLRTVRLAAPDAYLIYKPHPDVVAGLRSGGSALRDGIGLYDEVAPSMPLDQLFDAVDEVHVITSLTGFEALIRGVRVVTHGCPFYAGWGLTTDHALFPLRARILTLEELIAGALILYPTYLSRRSGRYTTVERVVSELILWRNTNRASEPRSPASMLGLLQRVRRRLLRSAAALRRPQRLTIH